MARTRDPFTRTQPLSKTAGKEPPGPNRTPGCRIRRSSRFLLIPARLATPAPLVSGAGRFNLYTGCTQFSLPVSFAEPPVRILSKLTRKMITDAAVLRMSAAGLLADSRCSMRIGARAACAASALWLFFLEPLLEPLTGQTRQAVSGSRIVTAAGMRPCSHALAAVGYIVDEFLRKYRMVNREACEAG